jgi:hypothetical protein
MRFQFLIYDFVYLALRLFFLLLVLATVRERFGGQTRTPNRGHIGTEGVKHIPIRPSNSKSRPYSLVGQQQRDRQRRIQKGNAIHLSGCASCSLIFCYNFCFLFLFQANDFISFTSF